MMRITLLSARTLRAQAYATVLRRVRGHTVSVVEYGQGTLTSKTFPAAASEAWEPLPEWLRTDWMREYEVLRQEWPLLATDEELNKTATLDLLTATSPEIVIYAGAAGSLVGTDLLGVAPFLHMHPGRLPDFRGSTTIYWSLLMGQPVSVSAIYLSESIDQGRVVKSQTFPNPTRQSDIDGIYDAGIRAAVLFQLISECTIPPPGEVQGPGGDDFYVIHPTLKNLAIQRLDL